MKLNVDAAYQYIDTLKKSSNAIGGDFTTLFHNENVADLNGWGEWGKRFFKNRT